MKRTNGVFTIELCDFSGKKDFTAESQDTEFTQRSISSSAKRCVLCRPVVNDYSPSITSLPPFFLLALGVAPSIFTILG